MYLFDASAILNLVKKGGVKIFLKGCTLDLAVYETFNAVWKETYLLKRIRMETALRLADLLSRVFDILEVQSVKGFEKEVMDIAVTEEVTFYDASYIYIASRNNLTLVTDDKKLANIAKKYVSVSTSLEVVK